MKRTKTILLLLLLALTAPAAGQNYRITVRLEGRTDSMLYIARHYLESLTPLDSARRKADGSYVFSGSRRWERGIYALVDQSRSKAIGDITIDGSQRFELSADAKLTPSSVKVKGCPANSQMFAYMAKVQEARDRMKAIGERKKVEATKAQAEADEKALDAEMKAYEAECLKQKDKILFFQLVNLFSGPEVPDDVEDKSYYYRTHFWDGVFDGQKNGTPAPVLHNRSILYSPQLFNRVNYFFFGLLYYADCDTIIKELDGLMRRVESDTALQRFILELITPKYFRSTKNIGWDAVWCHIAETYYLPGRCPWASEGTVYNMRYNYNRIRQSLIGAHGQELWMADTNQSNDPKDWISSHRFPEKYVILWFWDPDCHHCQEQSEQLKILYDSLQNAPDRRFEIYAVGFESDVPKWKKYVRDHKFKWVNVGGSNVNIDYQEAYNVHGAPTMIILNENRDIIMNKVLPAKNLISFLENYEKNRKR